MKDLKIERPDWTYMVMINMRVEDCRKRLDVWFTEHVEPINEAIRNGETLYKAENTFYWGKNQPIDNNVFSALLINRQPIKKETREEKLEALLTEWVEYEESIPDAMKPAYERIFERAKQVLEDQS